MSLDTNVYKLPSFSKLGFEQAQENKRQRDILVDSTGAEDTYLQSKSQLKGHFVDDARLAYGVFQEAGIKFKKSGSESDKRAMKEAANQLSLIITAGKTQGDIAGQAYELALGNQFQGYTQTKDEITKSYTDFQNRQWESKMENGILMVKEGDTFVPYNQSAIYSSQPNANNTFIIPKAVEQGKYFTVDSYLDLVKSVSGTSETEKLSKIYNDFDYRMKDASFASDVAMHYYANDLGLVDSRRGYNADDIREAEKRFAEDEEFRANAIKSYKEEIAAKAGVYLRTKATDGYTDTPFLEKNEDGTDIAFYPLSKAQGDVVALGRDENNNFYKIVSIEGQNVIQPATTADAAIIQGKAGDMPNPFAVTQQPSAEQQNTEVSGTQNQDEQDSVASDNESAMPEFDEDEFRRQQEAQRFDPDNRGFNIVPTQEQMDGLDLGDDFVEESQEPNQDNRQIASAEAGAKLLPNSFYDETLKSEGGLATNPDDRASRAAGNQDAPKVTQAMIDEGKFGDRKAKVGELIHTNRGVTYEIFKGWAEDNNIPKEDYQKRFLNLTEKEALSVVDGFTKNSGADQFESKVLRSMFTQNAWGTGKVFAADFQPDRSPEYRSLLDWLQEGTGVDFKSSKRISAEEAKAIEEFYNKNPQKFINEFFEKKQIYFTTLDEYDEFGNGWSDRAEKLRKLMLAEVGGTPRRDALSGDGRQIA